MRVRATMLLLTSVFLLGGFHSVCAIPPFGLYDGASFSPTITVLESNADRVRLHLAMENLPPSTPVNFSQPLPGLWENLNTTGNPVHLLPRFTVFVALPNTGNPTAVTETWDMEAHDVSPAINLQENTPGQPRVIVGSVGILGGVRVAAVTFKPIIYTNNAAACSVLTSATISIEIDDQQGDNPLTETRTSFSRPWQKVLEAVVANWEGIPNINVGAESHILMIVPNAFLEEVAGFVRWKEQRGIKVTVVPENSIGSNPDSSLIRTRIISELAASDPRIDYVILVGDESQLATRMQFTPDGTSRFSTEVYPGSFTNESVYAAIEGTDYFPDVFLGRWVVNTESEVLNVSNREILHERNTFAVDSARFEKSVVSADYTEASQRTTKRRVAHMLADHGFTYVDSVWGGSGDPSTAMTNAVNNGRTFVNYRGSGWAYYWWGIQFDIQDVLNLNNAGKLPVCTGIGCGVGKFDEPDGQCFGEVWMTAGTASTPKGAAGFIGPCWNTHTVYNDLLDSSLYRSFLDYDIHNLMPALVSGKMMEWAVMADFLDEGGVMEIVRTLFRQYLVLSDPSLQLFTDTPVRLDAVVPEAALADSNATYTVTINNMGALSADSVQVCAWLNDSVSVSQWIPQGLNSTTFNLNTSAADSMVVTITGDNVLAMQTTVAIGPPEPFLSHIAAELYDSTNGNGDRIIEPGETLDWYEIAQNIGSIEALDATATISSATPGVTITQPTVLLGTVQSGDTVSASNPITFAVAPSPMVGPDLEFTLTFETSNGPTREVPVTMQVHTPNLLLDTALVMDGNNNFWDRDETVNIQISIANGGDVNLAPGTYTLSTTDSLVSIVDGTETAPLIADSTRYTFADDAFAVYSSWATPAAHVANLTLTVSADMGTYTFTDEIPIQLVIGQVTPTDPFTDIGGHYWVYDNTDSMYSESPDFEWIEISPVAGGPGMEIPYSSGNQTRYYHVPFDFNYYGTMFDTLSVSTDGWVRPGRDMRTNYFNVPLPAPNDSIRGMIAPLWFNLWANSNETGEISFYYDPNSDRFIVEWYQVHDLSGQLAETFQLQLLNPATYPTASGDAEWLFLYQDLSPRATSGAGATVGIESPLQTNGFTYIDRGELSVGAATLENGRAIKITTEPPIVLESNSRMTVPIPTAVELRVNYPNPFNPETTIEFALPRADLVKLVVFDVLGRQVTTLIDGHVEAGVHRAIWRGTMESGASASSGVYFYRLETGGQAITRKMVLLR